MLIVVLELLLQFLMRFSVSPTIVQAWRATQKKNAKNKPPINSFINQ